MSQFSATAELEKTDRAAVHCTVGIVGAGAIGCFLGGILAQDKLIEVQFFGREGIGHELESHGLTVNVDALSHRCQQVAFYTSQATLLQCDVILVTVKATALAQLIPQIKKHARADVPIVALQNGIGVAAVFSAQLANPIYRAIVPFNVVKQAPGIFSKASGGDLLWPQTGNRRLQYLSRVFSSFGLAVQDVADMQSAEYGKLLLNLNNALNAISDLPLKQQLLNKHLRLVLAQAMTEWLAICQVAGIKPVTYTAVPALWLPRILRLPTPIFKILARRMLTIEPFARSSMWDDVQAGRRTEIMYLNGAVVNAGIIHGVATPVNAAIVDFIKHLEQGERISLDPLSLYNRLIAG
jgi:2-dehydropantoate 2-reductase